MANEDPTARDRAPTLERRRFLAVLTGAGAGTGIFPGVLWARLDADPEDVTAESIEDAERIAGVSFSPEQREMMVEGLRGNLRSFERLRDLAIPNDVPPAFRFDPTPPGGSVPSGRSDLRASRPDRLPDPSRPEEVAFASLAQLGALLRRRELTSVELTELYLDRLRRFDPELRCVVTLTSDLALEQARRADRELDAGRVRGPLHGIPWGAKDLLATRGYPTTWGAPPFRDQVIDRDATVVRKLEDAGAVLVAKLALGSLAMGDVWFDGTTRNPWNPEQGSSGSSAGSAAAAVAGLVGFAIGSETLGSIVSPAVRCGASGLRPTFGRVSRHGAMALSWSMDKLGPLCRSAEDCALVLSEIGGADGFDPTALDVPFEWDGESAADGIRIGVLASAFEGPEEERVLDRGVLEVLESLGLEFREVALPSAIPTESLSFILMAEAAAAFDDLTRSGMDAQLVRQGAGNWPNLFRTARLIPAVEYIQASRARTLLIAEVERAWQDVDVIVSPTHAPGILLTTNLTGHPAVVVPSGFRSDGNPAGISFVGGLWKESEALRVAHAYQWASGHHLRRPPGFS